MAQSRLEKIGTIFTRTTGLLRAGAMKKEDKPIWYDLYAAFPPRLEPRYDRTTFNIPIRNILYKEDEIKAKYSNSLKQFELYNLCDRKRETQSQIFTKIYKKLVLQGAVDKEHVFAIAKNTLGKLKETNKEFTEIRKDENITNSTKSKHILDIFKY